MDLNAIEQVVYGFLTGLTEILPVSARAHSTLMLKVLGADNVSNLSVLLIHIAIAAALYSSSQAQIVKMSRARKLSRIPKKRRKRPLDLQSLMDSRFLITMMLPVILMLLFYNKISGITFSLLAISALLFLNGVILYIPQFLPSGNKDARTLSRVEGILMGLGGSLSVFPGLSGIGTAVSVGSVCGVEHSYALNMSLLVHMVYIIGLIVFDVVALISRGFGTLSFQLILIYILSAATAFIGTMLAVRFMRMLSSGRGCHFFAYYCWGIALFAFILNLMA